MMKKAKGPVKKAAMMVKDKVKGAPNYNAKREPGMEAASKKVGKKVKR